MPDPAGGSPPPRSTRDTILDVAERHFAERGFAGASVRDMAADAGLKNQASLYHHFDNKRALYEAVLSRGLAPITELVTASGRIDTSVAPGSIERLTVFLDPVIDSLAAQPYLPRLLQRAALDDSRYLEDLLGRILRPLYTEGLAVIANSGAGWQPADYFHVGAALFQLIFGYFANAALFEIVAQHDPLAPEAIERQRRFLHTAVGQILGSPPGGLK